MARLTDCETAVDSQYGGTIGKQGNQWRSSSVSTNQGGILLLVRGSHDFYAAVGVDDKLLFGKGDGLAWLSDFRVALE